jgi:hypothetical protein
MGSSKFIKHSSVSINGKNRCLYIKSGSKSKTPILYIRHKCSYITYKQYLQSNKKPQQKCIQKGGGGNYTQEYVKNFENYNLTEQDGSEGHLADREDKDNKNQYTKKPAFCTYDEIIELAESFIPVGYAYVDKNGYIYNIENLYKTYVVKKQKPKHLLRGEDYDIKDIKTKYEDNNTRDKFLERYKNYKKQYDEKLKNETAVISTNSHHLGSDSDVKPSKNISSNQTSIRPSHDHASVNNRSSNDVIGVYRQYILDVQNTFMNDATTTRRSRQSLHQQQQAQQQQLSMLITQFKTFRTDELMHIMQINQARLSRLLEEIRIRDQNEAQAALQRQIDQQRQIDEEDRMKRLEFDKILTETYDNIGKLLKENFEEKKQQDEEELQKLKKLVKNAESQRKKQIETDARIKEERLERIKKMDLDYKEWQEKIDTRKKTEIQNLDAELNILVPKMPSMKSFVTTKDDVLEKMKQLIARFENKNIQILSIKTRTILPDVKSNTKVTDAFIHHFSTVSDLKYQIETLPNSHKNPLNKNITIPSDKLYIFCGEIHNIDSIYNYIQQTKMKSNKYISFEFDIRKLKIMYKLQGIHANYTNMMTNIFNVFEILMVYFKATTLNEVYELIKTKLFIPFVYLLDEILKDINNIDITNYDIKRDSKKYYIIKTIHYHHSLILSYIENINYEDEHFQFFKQILYNLLQIYDKIGLIEISNYYAQFEETA